MEDAVAFVPINREMKPILGHRGRWSFATRLVVSMLAALVLVGVVGYTLQSRQIEQRIMDTHKREQRADAATFLAIGQRTEDGLDELFREIDEVMVSIRKRPGMVETLLMDDTGLIRVAGGDHAAVGRLETDPHVMDALAHGRAYAGHETNPDRDPHDLSFIVPVELAGRRYAYEMTLDNRSLDSELGDARSGLLWNGLLTLLLGGIVFYAAGGRALLRSHRLALQRATRDSLTDLPNQRAFYQDLPAAVSTAARHGDPLVLMLLDADDFKFINDRHGHPHGDEVLRRIAAILRDGRAGDLLYRIGGDEFAVLLPRTDGDGARTRARRLLRALEQANLKMSVGMAELVPGRGADVLQREADAALYEAKRRGGHTVVHIDDIRSEVAVATTEKLSAIHQLLDERRLDVAYQPIWNLREGRLLALEALARPHADYGFDGPAEAFDLAEQIAQVPRLDALCVTRALTVAPSLPAGALLFMNLSPLTLDVSGEDDDWLLHAVAASGLAPQQIVIEVTERFGARTTGVVKSLKRLQAQGFKVALDDVGTGNSGLEMLRLLDADFVKLDRSIVAAAPHDPNARAVLMAMATFASHTGAFVIAEGIEDEDMLEFLGRVADGDFAADTIIQGGQGFGLGRPSHEIRYDAMPLTLTSVTTAAASRVT